MFKSSVFSLLASTLAVEASPLLTRADKPPAFFLAGDSTTAVQSTGGGGWGDGFLDTTLTNGAWGTNFGHNGATTASFRSGGDWANVLAAVANASSSYAPYVTIQFGHNDQKSTSGVTIEQFTQNLETFVADVRDAGATPILVTSLSRRNYDTSVDPPVVDDSLADVRAATIEAADATGAAIAHLNEESMAYLNAIGPDDAYTYNLNEDDHTHLNYDGSIVFGGMMAELILEAFPDLDEYIQVDEELAEDLENGVYYWPGV